MNKVIQLNDLSNPQEVIVLINYLKDIYRKITLVSTGTAAPTTTPQTIGDEFLDTTNKKFYKAFGTSSSADWIIQN